VHELSRDQPKITWELFDIVTRHAYGEEAVEAIFVQGEAKEAPAGNQGAPPKAASKGMKRSTKGNKRGPKRCPQWIAVIVSCDQGDNDKEANDSDEEHVNTTKRQA
jgi:hypothetical protein